MVYRSLQCQALSDEKTNIWMLTSEPRCSHHLAPISFRSGLCMHFVCMSCQAKKTALHLTLLTFKLLFDISSSFPPTRTNKQLLQKGQSNFRLMVSN